MKKKFFAAVILATLLFAVSSYAYEIQFRTGPLVGVNDNYGRGTQYKIGINFAGTSKGAESGFYTSTTLDLSLLDGSTVIWLEPEFQYDFMILGLPLYVYPKFSLLFVFGFYPGDTKGIGFGIKPAAGVKFDVFDWLFVWAEPFAMNIVFAQYLFTDITANGWNKSTAVSYEAMFGVGFRI